MKNAGTSTPKQAWWCIIKPHEEKQKGRVQTDFTLTVVHLKSNSDCCKVSPFSVIKTDLTVTAQVSPFPYCPVSSLLLQSAGELIHHHCFLQLPISNQRKGKTQKEQQHPWSTAGSSLPCLQSAPSFICSFAGWDEPLLRL